MSPYTFPSPVQERRAQKRAMDLLRSFLTEDQQRELKAFSRICVDSQLGNTYMLILGSASIRQVKRNGVPVHRDMQWFGIYARTYGLEVGYPPADGMLAMKLLLETDERAVLRAACH